MPNHIDASLNANLDVLSESENFSRPSLAVLRITRTTTRNTWFARSVTVSAELW